MNNKSAEIIVAEDDKSVRLVVQQALARQGYAVQSSGTAAGLWKLVDSGKGDVLITDVALPDGDALDLLPRIQQRRPDLPLIVMSARSTLLTAVKTQQIGVFEYLPKPFELRSLIEITQRAVAAVGSSSSAPVAGPPPLGTTSLDGAALVGRSPAMQEIFKAMARIVSNDLTVLISGESGTGKELVARALHDLGHRKAGQFVVVNLAAVPRDMVETELFGQVGPSDEVLHQGCFSKADGGTLFLDEVGDMPAAVQTRLLRVLQDNLYLPVGANRPVEVHLRVMASTNQNLYHLMHQGLFREDLFYRLNVVPLKLPPLRERAEDIGPLIGHFIARAEADGMPAKQFTSDALQRLKAWHWPGNVRELENLIRRLLVLHADDFIDAYVIDRELFDQAPVEPAESESLSGSVDMHIRRYFQALKGGVPAPGLYGRILREVEHPLIVATLEMTRGNQVRAADILGLNRNTLRKKITELNIRAGR